jgi:hypothetical protein
VDLTTIARDGVFSTATAARFGIDAAALRRLIRAGDCSRLRPGWYACGVPATESDAWRLRVAAAAQEYEGRAVLSHDAALLRLGLPTFHPELTRVDLTWVDAATPAHLGRWVRLHCSPFRAASADSGSAPAMDTTAGTTSGTVEAALAVAQVGLRSRRALLVAGDAALRTRVATREDVTQALAALDGHRGVVAARAVAHRLQPLHESPGESLTAWLLHQLGYPLVAQYEVPGSADLTASGWPDRADFLVEGTRVLVEFDGKVKYTGRDVLFAEKQREDRIRSLGFEVVRLTWADLAQPGRVRQLLEAALARSASRHGRRPA